MDLLGFWLLTRRTENGRFDLIYSGILFVFVTAFILWDRRYRRRWQEFRARNWLEVPGRFDEGEIITMMKGRSKTVAGYEVCMGYEYQTEGEQGGVYRYPEMPNREDAEAMLKLLADKNIVVRVDPSKPSRSYVLGNDAERLLSIQRQSRN
jgi:hypothetical protein